jgi:AcrR family transcriptional regulator
LTSEVRKSDQTRAAILNAALDFLWSHRFRDLTTASLMASTSVGRTTFYRYFRDLHELMEALLNMFRGDILVAAEPWIAGAGDPVSLLNEAISGVVETVYRRGPFLRAIVDAAATDRRFEGDWQQFLQAFDDATCNRIEADQAQGLIPGFDARPVAVSLTRLNAYTLLDAFGQRPRQRKAPARQALARVWISTLYGSEWTEKETSTLERI